MSRGINKVILIGNLGADPDVRYLPSGDPVANLRLATSETWKDKATGQPQERTEWHNVVLFGKIADVAQEYLRKGSRIYVEGKLRTRQWRTSDGQDRYTMEVVVDLGGTMQMLDSRPASSEPVNAHRPPSNRVAADSRPKLLWVQKRAVNSRRGRTNLHLSIKKEQGAVGIGSGYNRML